MTFALTGLNFRFVRSPSQHETTSRTSASTHHGIAIARRPLSNMMRVPNGSLARSKPKTEHGRHIFAYCNVTTNQVLYSLTQTLKVRLQFTVLWTETRGLTST